MAQLGFYGGPTKTHALLPNSPVVDKGSNALAIDVTGSPLMIDQRGSTRPVDLGATGPTDGTIDIGAYELSIITPLVVSSLTDTIDGQYGDNQLSLREALALSELTPGPDTITFAAGLFANGPQTISLTGGQLIVHGVVTVAGPGKDSLTIDAHHSSRVFLIANDATATLGQLTVTGGQDVDGAGIYVVGNLTLDTARVADNVATTGRGGGIFVYQTLLIENSIVEGNSAGSHGGGIYVSDVGYATIKRTTIDDNSAYYGAGVMGYLGSGERLIIDSSTVSHNRAVGTYASGGGVMIQSPTSAVATIVNSTISNNTAPARGGLYALWGTSHFEVTNSTIAYNQADYGGGITLEAGGTATLNNTIVAENKNIAGIDSDVSGVLDWNTSFNNLIGRGGAAGFSDGDLHQNIVLASGESAGLSPLGDFGGPTKTHALKVGSPALDAGNDNRALDAEGDLLTVDQRGHRRPFELLDVVNSGVGCVDIGAFEAGNPAPLYVKTTEDELDDIHAPDFRDDDDDLSLREALAIAKENAGGYEIHLEDLSGSINLGALGELQVTKDDDSNISIIGPYSPDQLRIDAYGLVYGNRAFHVFGIPTASISNLTIVGGYTDGNGGGILNETNLNLASVTISRNHAAAGGGVCSTGGGTTTIINSEISGNSATSIAGGISQSRGTLDIDQCSIVGNSARLFGGGVLVAGNSSNIATARIASSVIANNSADYVGGLLGQHSAVSVVSSTITGNWATTGYGGGVWLMADPVDPPEMIFTNDTITGNNAVTGAGGLVNASFAINLFPPPPEPLVPAPVKLVNTIVAGNTQGGNTQIDVSGVFDHTSNHNIIGVLPDFGGLEYDATTFALSGSASQPADPGLVSIPGTYEFTLAPDSPAIDAGDDNAVTAQDIVFDQMGYGFQRTLGEHVDIGGNEAHVIQDGTTLKVYGTALDDQIYIDGDSVSLDRIGVIPYDSSLVSNIEVDSGEGNDNVQNVTDTPLVDDRSPDPDSPPSDAWTGTEWRYDPGHVSLATFNPALLKSNPEFILSSANDDDLSYEFRVGWKIDPKLFVDADGKMLVDTIGIVQIVKQTTQGSTWPVWQSYYDSITNCDWQVDKSIPYPYPTSAFPGSATSATVVKSGLVKTISLFDNPGLAGYGYLYYAPFRTIDSKFEIETYVVGLTGKEGIQVGHTSGRLTDMTWLKSVTVFAGYSWGQHFVYNLNGTYTPTPSGPTPIVGISENFKKAMWNYYYSYTADPPP